MVDTVTIHQEGHSPPPHRREVSGQKPIDKAKASVTLPELVELLASEQGKRLMGHGKERFTSCPLPDHDDPSPSFYFNPDKGLWFCHGCGRGGDVVHLAALAWGHGDDMVSAAVDLLLTFGHPLPQRPPSWFRKQERQKPIRDAIDRARFDHLRRRLYHAFFAPSVEAIRDEAEREEEERLLWEATDLLARMMLRDLSERRSA